MSMQLIYSTKVEFSTEDLAQVFTDDVVKICGRGVMTFTDRNDDRTWTVRIDYDGYCSDSDAFSIIEKMDRLLSDANAESKKSSRVYVEVYGGPKTYWIGPMAHIEEARSYARLLRTALDNLTDDEAKQVLEVLVSGDSTPTKLE